MQKQKVAALLAPTVPLKLEVEADKNGVLELELAWTMRAVILIETKLRALGVKVNVLQNPEAFWTDMDCTALAVAVWALAHQSHPDLRDEAGFDSIVSYITPENYAVATIALKEAFLESLSKKRRDEVEAAVQAAVEAGTKPPANPTPAPAQS